MLTAKQLENAVTTTARNYNKAAFANVLAIALYGLQFGTKDAARRTMRDKLTEENPDGKRMAYSTAARQVAFGMDMAAHIRAKYPEHAVMTSLRDAETAKVALESLESFMAGLNVRSGNEAALWVKTDGLTLTDDKRLALYKAPVKAEPKAEEPAPAEAPAPAKAEEPAPAPAEEPAPAADPVETVLAMMGDMDDATLRRILKAANDVLKARKAAQPLAA